MITQDAIFVAGLEQCPGTNFYARFAKYRGEEYAMEFEAWKAVQWGQGPDGKYTIPEFGDSCNGASPQTNEDNRYLHGSIKWDGCMNWDFQDTSTMQHHCGLDDTDAFAKLIVWIHEQGRRLANWDRSLADRTDGPA